MKRALTMILAIILVLGLFAGCEKTEEQGKVFNIWAWNTEFKEYFEIYYEGTRAINWKAVDAAKEKGETVEPVYYTDAPGLPEGITVNWVINANDGGVYKEKLDEALMNQENLPADEKIDMFLLEVDHNILQYTNSEYTQDITKIGVTDFSNVYAYTKQAASDANGVVKGVSFQCCPAALIYRRSIAKDVLGTDDPAEVQALLSDWDKFNAVAATAKEKGYYMTASDAATYRVFSNNVTAPWVDANNNLQVDTAIQTWMDQAKNFSDNGYTINTGIWDAPCTDQMFADGKTMCYFGPAWYFNFSMDNAQDPDKGCFGDWAICQGPQAHFWGGTWLMASASSDNTEMLASVMNAFINDQDICSGLVADQAQFSNNQTVNAKFAADPEYGSAFLGGQNDVAVFVELAKNIKFENQTIYDQIINETLQTYWREYCQGTVTEEEALANWYKAIKEKYPNIVTP